MSVHTNEVEVFIAACALCVYAAVQPANAVGASVVQVSIARGVTVVASVLHMVPLEEPQEGLTAFVHVPLVAPNCQDAKGYERQRDAGYDE